MKSATHILGISAYYHDSAACLVTDGEIICAAQEERFSRRKHDHRFPSAAIRFCLEHASIGPDQLSYIVFYDKPLRKFDRLLETYIDYAPRGFRSFVRAMPLWIFEKLWVREEIAEKCRYRGKVLFTDHHESHAASAFFPSPFESAAILTIDGVGEWATSSWGTGRGNRIRLREEMHFPHSLGLLYSAFTYYTGFRVNSGEYKLMGLAPYGEPRFIDKILKELVQLCDDGSIRLNMKYFNFCEGLTMTNAAFDRLFGGPARQPESKLTQRDMDIARSIQDVTELSMLRMARYVHGKTGEKNLCLAGGVALNCVGNGRILREGPFENLWIQPAAGDAGGALGAALSVWHQYLENPRQPALASRGGHDSMKGSYLGPAFTNHQVELFRGTLKAPYRRMGRRELVGTVAKWLADQKIVGWFQGAMEFGPRALGARSILGDPRSPRMQSVMNLKIKFRESFRPFAPSVLQERAADIFDLNCESPYMLLIAPVRDSLHLPLTEEQSGLSGIERLSVPRSIIPAVTHVDYSARVQTVRREDNPLYHELLEEFERLTGCPVLVNTSFNVRGEPIVCTPEDAFRCFMRTEMDYLVIEDMAFAKTEQDQGTHEFDRLEEYQLD